MPAEAQNSFVRTNHRHVVLLGHGQLAGMPAVAYLDQQGLEHVQTDVLDREQGERLRQHEFAAISVEGEQRLAELGPQRLERAASLETQPVQPGSRAQRGHPAACPPRG